MPTGSDATEGLSEFFDYIWSDTEAFVYLPTLDRATSQWVKAMFMWPRQKSGVIRHVLKQTSSGLEVFYSPALYKQARPIKENVQGSWTFWVDFDGNAPVPEELSENVPQPTLRMRSSLEGHEHWYWRLDEFVTDIATIDERNRSLAYLLQADTSGWDADQVLRPPFTRNYKRDRPVEVLTWESH